MVAVCAIVCSGNYQMSWQKESTTSSIMYRKQRPWSLDVAHEEFRSNCNHLRTPMMLTKRMSICCVFLFRIEMLSCLPSFLQFFDLQRNSYSGLLLMEERRSCRVDAFQDDARRCRRPHSPRSRSIFAGIGLQREQFVLITCLT